MKNLGIFHYEKTLAPYFLHLNLLIYDQFLILASRPTRTI